MVTTIMQFDDIRTSDKELKFTDLSGGTKTITYDGSNNAELNIGGNSYKVKVDGEKIKVDLNDDNTIADEVDNITMGITAKGGAMITFEKYTDNINVIITTLGNNFDTSGDDEVINFSIVKRANEEVGIVNVDGVYLFELESNDDKKMGLTPYGVSVIYDDSGNDAETLTLEYPLSQRGAQVFVTAGDVTTITSGSSGTVETISLEAIEIGAAVLASEISDVKAQNMIMVGGPCANEVARKVIGVDVDKCAEGFSPGKALIKLYDTGNGNVAILVAGDQAMDTRAAARVLANADAYDLTGNEVEIAYTSLTDITVKTVT